MNDTNKQQFKLDQIANNTILTELSQYTTEQAELDKQVFGMLDTVKDELSSP